MVWVRCPECGHKLLSLDVRAGDKASFEIKCSSCKILAHVDIQGEKISCVRIGGKSRFERNEREFQELTVRTRNAVLRAGAESKRDLVAKLKDGLLVSGIGDKGIEELEQFVGENINGDKRKKIEISPGYFVVKRILKFSELKDSKDK